jgi:8-oxo-dGTP pyrophosphatase MutT (NUDIX family)
MTAPIIEQELRRLAAVTLHQSPPPWPTASSPAGGPVQGPSDYDLNPDLAGVRIETHPIKRAAVLVPIVAHENLTVLLTQRTETLPRHAGQISFPGGRIDPGDAGPRETAMREANEEIGLAQRFIEPLGYLDTYRTGTGFLVVPVVALIRPGFTLAINPHEVVSVFEVPLTFLLDRANHQHHERIIENRERFFYAIPFGNYYIWGATAGMIRNLSDRLSQK